MNQHVRLLEPVQAQVLPLYSAVEGKSRWVAVGLSGLPSDPPTVLVAPH